MAQVDEARPPQKLLLQLQLLLLPRSARGAWAREQRVQHLQRVEERVGAALAEEGGPAARLEEGEGAEVPQHARVRGEALEDGPHGGAQVEGQPPADGHVELE